MAMLPITAHAIALKYLASIGITGSSSFNAPPNLLAWGNEHPSDIFCAGRLQEIIDEDFEQGSVDERSAQNAKHVACFLRAPVDGIVTVLKVNAFLMCFQHCRRESCTVLLGVQGLVLAEDTKKAMHLSRTGMYKSWVLEPEKQVVQWLALLGAVQLPQWSTWASLHSDTLS